MHPHTRAHKYAKPCTHPHIHTLTKIKENTHISKTKLDLLPETNRQPVSEPRSLRPTLAIGERVVGEGGLLNRQRSETRPHFAKEEASSHQEAHLPFAHRSVPSPRLSRLSALSIFDIIHGGFVERENHFLAYENLACTVGLELSLGRFQHRPSTDQSQHGALTPERKMYRWQLAGHPLLLRASNDIYPSIQAPARRSPSLSSTDVQKAHPMCTATLADGEDIPGRAARG